MIEILSILMSISKYIPASRPPHRDLLKEVYGEYLRAFGWTRNWNQIWEKEKTWLFDDWLKEGRSSMS